MVEDKDARIAALEAQLAEAKGKLNEIACWSQSQGLLWWQVKAREGITALEASPPAPKVTEADGQREVLLFASYCGDDNTACSEVRPCPICLGMSNVVAIPNDTPLEHRRALEPRWNSNKHLEALNARRIGKAPKCTLTAAQEAGKP